EKVIGVINISQTEGNLEYSQSDIELLSLISAQALMAIENMKFVQEKEKSIRMQALFEQFVSPEVAHLLVKSQKNLHDIGGVEEITVLFADIRNFTSLVQKLPLVQLREFLNAFFDIFSDVVFSRKGTLDKFMGDAVLVIFGEPIKLENSCKAAVDAALDIGEKFEILRKKWNEKYKIFHEIGIGIGISNGNVFLGNVGSSKRLDYTVIGKDVNVAQRLAADTRSGQILVTESVRKEVCERFQVKQEKDRLLKGMENKMELYTIVGRS
ncbi:MAG: hypothetical protein GY705_31475, partial [Bacteroidetes bacterium]|nr:hypothetical protein [Bacteroidota bacterium]